jgi:hypothetical protein
MTRALRVQWQAEVQVAQKFDLTEGHNKLIAIGNSYCRSPQHCPAHGTANVLDAPPKRRHPDSIPAEYRVPTCDKPH